MLNKSMYYDADRKRFYRSCSICLGKQRKKRSFQKLERKRKMLQTAGSEGKSTPLLPSQVDDGVACAMALQSLALGNGPGPATLAPNTTSLKHTSDQHTAGVPGVHHSSNFAVRNHLNQATALREALWYQQRLFYNHMAIQRPPTTSHQHFYSMNGGPPYPPAQFHPTMGAATTSYSMNAGPGVHPTLHPTHPTHHVTPPYPPAQFHPTILVGAALPTTTTDM